MHELGIVFHVIDRIEELAKENELQQVASVTLELGEASGVVPHYLTDCWDWAVKKSEVMKGSKLLIEPLPAITYCEDCEQTYPTIEFGKICPHCQSPHTYLLTGNECNIKEIEAM